MRDERQRPTAGTRVGKAAVRQAAADQISAKRTPASIPGTKLTGHREAERAKAGRRSRPDGRRPAPATKERGRCGRTAGGTGRTGMRQAADSERPGGARPEDKQRHKTTYIGRASPGRSMRAGGMRAIQREAHPCCDNGNDATRPQRRGASEGRKTERGRARRPEPPPQRRGPGPGPAG